VTTPDVGERLDSPLRGYLAMLRRRKWYVLIAVVFCVGVALAYSYNQANRYRATATVLISQNLAGALGGGSDVYQDPNRLARTQLEIARVPELRERVIRKLGLTGDVAASFLDNARVAARSDADLLDFSAEDGLAARARVLATAYAAEFTRYRRSLEATAYRRAEVDVRKRLGQLKKAGEDDSELYQTLLERAEQLRTLRTVGSSDAVVLRPADEAERTQPRPVRNAMLAGLLGLLIGVVAVGVAEALDTRLRSGDDVVEGLDVPLLGRIPTSAARRRRRDPLVMLRTPSGAGAEAFRILRANVDFVLRDSDSRAIMVASASELQGKSTTLANLAIAFALGGRHVIAADLDLRRPSLHTLFGITSTPGITDVATGRVELDRALMSATLPSAGSRNGRESQVGKLEILPAGSLPPDPAEFVGQEHVRTILQALRLRADLVLIDTPPLLSVSDGITLSDEADGLLLIVRPSASRRDELREFRRVFEQLGTEKLGCVITGSESSDGYTYGGYYASSVQKS
jgi:capsular exopolysaccharide synthesis family protein